MFNVIEIIDNKCNKIIIFKFYFDIWFKMHGMFVSIWLHDIKSFTISIFSFSTASDNAVL